MKGLMIAIALLVAASAASAQTVCRPPACDIDGNGTFAGPDVLAFYGAFGKAPGQPGYNARADMDGDRIVSGVDFAVFVKFCPL